MEEDNITNYLKNNNRHISFIKRLLSGIILLIALFVVLFVGGDLLLISSSIISIIGLIELFRVFKLANSMLAYVGYLLTAFYYIILVYYRSSGILLFLISLLLFLLIFYVLTYPRYSIKEVSMIFFGIIYVAVTFSFIYLIREKNELGKYMVWLIFISSWGADTFAYCVGSLVGRHKFLPELSPNKTLEGVIGGIVGSAVLGFLYTFVLLNKLNFDISYTYLRVALACAVGSVISILGDLTASAIKRDYSVKDYGNLIPGHGGILDRFDSVIFAAPALFFILSV